MAMVVWILEILRAREFFFLFWAIFCAFAFTPLTTWKINQNFENMKKMPVKISSFYTSICISYDERFLRYGAQQMSFLNFLSFVWTIFCPFQFYPQQPRKSKFWKNEKMTGDIIILHTGTINENHHMIVVI